MKINELDGGWLTRVLRTDEFEGFSVKEERTCETGQMNRCLTPSVKHEWSALGLVSWEIDTECKEHEMLPFYFTTSCRSLWSALDWFQFHHAASTKIQSIFQSYAKLFGEETESQSTVFGLACIIARFKTYWAPVGQALVWGQRKMPYKPVTPLGSAAECVGWNLPWISLKPHG